MHGWRLLALAACVGTALPTPARAFCGFYVGGADAELYSDATMVVLMREGTRTVLSMQNRYEGPPEAFALVVPVPEVVREANVRTLPRHVFERVDALAAPRLVEYWEQDPCYQPPRGDLDDLLNGALASRMSVSMSSSRSRGVTVEARFAVGEYDIVVLGAEDSSGLEAWLHDHDYAIPQGASQVLNPYVQLGTKFFVAKVDPARVRFEDGRAVLSPLRVHYDSPQFSLPVRLGQLNSQGQQDLLIHILAKRQRFEVANLPNVIIPTNLRVDEAVRGNFGAFYRALFDRVAEENPGAVVTEYAWSAASCDPCPTPALGPQEITLLGADVIDGAPVASDGLRPIRVRGEPAGRVGRGQAQQYTLTRLHLRYEQALTRDLVFRAAPAIVGGRGTPDPAGHLQEKHAEVRGRGFDNFQGRYVILHPWEGDIDCRQPVHGRWGGPPGQHERPPRPVAAPSALRTAGPAAAVELASVVHASDASFLAVQSSAAADPSLGVLPEPEPEPEPEPAAEPEPASEPPVPTTEPSQAGCASCAAGSGSAGGLVLLLLVLFSDRRVRR